MAGAFAEAVAGAVSGVADIGFGLYDRYYQAKMNERDFDYQKALQQQIFDREDNAVQRRRADLEAAGLNPNLAAGSAAGAGSVVGRSSTPGLPKIGNPIGTALDTAQHVAQLRAQREQNEILKNQKKLSDYQTNTELINSAVERAALYQQLGIKDMKLSFDNGIPLLWHKNWRINLDDSPLMKQLEWQYQNNKNAADLLQRDVDFYTADKIANYFGIGASMFSNAGRGWSLFNNKQYRR